MSYKKAITILTNLETFDQYRTIVIKLAQEHPSILVSLTEEKEEKEEVVKFSDNVRWIAAFIYRNPASKIDGIKGIRATFGFKLKEAKDVFEYVQSGVRNLEFLAHTDDVIDIGTKLRKCYLTFF